jgi:glycosyltransferase involved in cell wall biosynthesis
MKVSIITIVRNAERYVERTVRSVLAQDYPDREYIFIDGGSTDGTLARIEAFRQSIDVLVSEPDKGISDAWNKGLAIAKGEIIGLLNAGDEHDASAISRSVAAIRAGAELTYGDTDLVDDDGRVIMTNRGRFHLWKYSAGIGFYHPSCFATRALYDRVGGFDLNLRYAMDTDWIVRAAVAGAVIRHAGSRTRMVNGGVSVQNRFLAYGEHLQVLRRHCGRAAPYKSMVMTGLRGLARVAIGRIRSDG